MASGEALLDPEDPEDRGAGDHEEEGGHDEESRTGDTPNPSSSQPSGASHQSRTRGGFNFGQLQGQLQGRFQEAQARTKEQLEHARGRLEPQVRDARGRIQDAADKASANLKQAKEDFEAGKYNNLHKDVAAYVKEHIDEAAMQAAGFGEVGKAKIAKRRKEANLALVDLTGPLRAKVLLAVRDNLKSSATSDRDMPDCMKRLIADGVDLLWEDITIFIETAVEDVKANVQGQRLNDYTSLANLGEKPCCMGPNWWRTFVLYHFLPFDVSIWGQFKDPIFWTLTILSCIPLFGFRVIFFLLLLIAECVDWPPDEYQLVQFILMFKGCQFLSSGVLMSVYLSIKYYLCIHPGHVHTCTISGPASWDGYDYNYWNIFDLVGSCVLTWVAFLLLPTSTRSGGDRYINSSNGKSAPDLEEEREKEARCFRYDPKHGGRINALLKYDLICFFFSVIFIAFLGFVSVSHLRPGGIERSFDRKQMQHALLKDGYFQSWDFRVAVYYTRIVYSLLAAPFTVFYLPVLSGILTHTTPTGYNKQGKCVAYMLPPFNMDEPAE